MCHTTLLICVPFGKRWKIFVRLLMPVHLFIFLSPQFITFYIGLQVIPVRQTFNSPFLLIANFIWTSHLISFFPLFSSTDERDAIQKKTFTKWVNKHLKKVSRKDNHQHCKRCEIGERSFTLHCDDQMVHAEFFQFFFVHCILCWYCPVLLLCWVFVVMAGDMQDLHISTEWDDCGTVVDVYYEEFMNVLHMYSRSRT